MDVEFSKSANSATIVVSYTHIVVFVWRQLGFAFFGALTSVGALFVLKGGIFDHFGESHRITNNFRKEDFK